MTLALELGGIESPEVRRAFEQIALRWPSGAAGGYTMKGGGSGADGGSGNNSLRTIPVTVLQWLGVAIGTQALGDVPPVKLMTDGSTVIDPGYSRTGGPTMQPGYTAAGSAIFARHKPIAGFTYLYGTIVTTATAPTALIVASGQQFGATTEGHPEVFPHIWLVRSNLGNIYELTFNSGNLGQITIDRLPVANETMRFSTCYPAKPLNVGL